MRPNEVSATTNFISKKKSDIKNDFKPCGALLRLNGSSSYTETQYFEI